jgi:hypothetical protein
MLEQLLSEMKEEFKEAEDSEKCYCQLQQSSRFPPNRVRQVQADQDPKGLPLCRLSPGCRQRQGASRHRRTSTRTKQEVPCGFREIL